MKKINVGLIGLGTVGQGVVKILRERKSFLSGKIGCEIEIKKICDKDLSAKRKVPVDKSLLHRNPLQLIDDPSIDVIVELIGGINPAKEYIARALEKGKHVVTANKALLAEKGRELFTLSADKGKSIYFEASVGGGIPILKAIREGLVANKFHSILGIVNGTSNYVLSQMSENKYSFAESLREAKSKGFAEKDPSLDLEGVDSAHKLILLSYLCFGKFIDLKDVFVEGIARISLADVVYAQELGFEIKLLAIAKKEAQKLDVRVHPTLIPKHHLLASVSGVHNAIFVSSDFAGDLLFFGPGAGQLSAASAVISDLVDLAHDIQAGLFRPTLKIVEDKSIKQLSGIDDIASRYYIRFMAMDKPGVLAAISGVLAKYNISIASVTQKERKKQEAVPIVMITHEAQEKNLKKALRIIDASKEIKEKSVAIRIEKI